jgi:hypothetical protein
MNSKQFANKEQPMCSLAACALPLHTNKRKTSAQIKVRDHLFFSLNLAGCN